MKRKRKTKEVGNWSMPLHKLFLIMCKNLLFLNKNFQKSLYRGRGNAPHPTPSPAQLLRSLVLAPPPHWKILATPVDKIPVSIYFVLPLPSLSSLPIFSAAWLIAHGTQHPPPPRSQVTELIYPTASGKKCVRMYPPPPSILPLMVTGWGVVNVHL